MPHLPHLVHVFDNRWVNPPDHRDLADWLVTLSIVATNGQTMTVEVFVIARGPDDVARQLLQEHKRENETKYRTPSGVTEAVNRPAVARWAVTSCAVAHTFGPDGPQSVLSTETG